MQNSDCRRLRECAFCGKQVAIIDTCHELEDCANFERCGDGGYYSVVCSVNRGGCGASAGYARTEREAINRWNRRAQPEITGETSDGYHTFNELYHHRAALFSVICNDRPALAWKSKLHHDGTMYDGMFIVGIQTPEGQATYHYDIDPYWVMFCVPELPQAPEWDGHTPTQAIERIGKLCAQPENKPLTPDELREMDGEPVYIVTFENQLENPPYWAIAGINSNDSRYQTGVALYNRVQDDWGAFELYGDTWLAYRRKPERSEG